MANLFRQNRNILILGLLLSIFLFCGCGESEEKEASLLKLSLAEGYGYIVENNGQEAEQGSEISFSLVLEDGYQLVGSDYEGESRIYQEDNHAILTLEEVDYPGQIHPTVTNQYFIITYNSNDENPQEITTYEERKYHVRPNTLNAVDGFTRDGYSLVAWNTKEDGSGERIGLGSRVTVKNEGITLYAMWEPWTDQSYFTYYEIDGEIHITACSCSDETLVIPTYIDGIPVAVLEKNSLENNAAKTVVLPEKLRGIEADAFLNAKLESLVVYDNLECFYNENFTGCEQLQTVYINAVEKPAGAASKKESTYADKVDLLILAQGKTKIIFYGGCSMWYNLDMSQVLNAYKGRYIPLDLALNGTVNSEVQMQIIYHYLENEDVFFHTPELSSKLQLLEITEMGKNDNKLWGGLEYNYDLFSLVDVREFEGWATSFQWYLDHKKDETEYSDVYLDAKKRNYLGENGEVPFERYFAEVSELSDEVTLSREVMSDEAKKRLIGWYDRISDKGVKVYVSYACLNMDAITKEEAGYLKEIDTNFHSIIESSKSAVLISTIWDFCYYHNDFYDTNYHLLTPYAYTNTEKWLRDLEAYL